MVTSVILLNCVFCPSAAACLPVGREGYLKRIARCAWCNELLHLRVGDIGGLPPNIFQVPWLAGRNVRILCTYETSELNAGEHICDACYKNQYHEATIG